MPFSTKIRHILLLVGISASLCVGCGESIDKPVSAGSNRRAPAEDLSPVFDDTTEEDAGTREDHRTGPVDRILREGASGTVTLVIDGDTLHVTVDGWYHVVRLQGINAPECGRALVNTTDGNQYQCVEDEEIWGLSSSEVLEAQATGAAVTVTCDREPGEACPTDTFDRFLAFVESDELGDFGEWMARNGHALSFTKFSSTRRAEYCQAEDLARSEGLGMWSLGSRDEVLAQMSSGTRSWYADRDRLCAEAMEN